MHIRRWSLPSCIPHAIPQVHEGYAVDVVYTTGVGCVVYHEDTHLPLPAPWLAQLQQQRLPLHNVGICQAAAQLLLQRLQVICIIGIPQQHSAGQRAHSRTCLGL